MFRQSPGADVQASANTRLGGSPDSRRIVVGPSSIATEFVWDNVFPGFLLESICSVMVWMSFKAVPQVV
jgi:hypothetical protein